MAITKIVIGYKSTTKTVVDFGDVANTEIDEVLTGNKFYNGLGEVLTGTYDPPKLVGSNRSIVAEMSTSTFDNYTISSKADFNKSVVITPNSSSTQDGIEGAIVNIRLDPSKIYATTTNVNMTSDSYLYSIPTGWHEGSKIKVTVDTYNGEFE